MLPSGKTCQRPLKLLYPIECQEQPESTTSSPDHVDCQDDHTTTRDTKAESAARPVRKTAAASRALTRQLVAEDKI